SSYDYQIEIALSSDMGANWSAPLIPHSDRSFAQHGFVSMVPNNSDELTVIWLDGRAYGVNSDPAQNVPDAMQLRATTLTESGDLGRDVAIDLQTCSCCQTSLATNGDGTILAAYRDLKEGDIRDISLVRWTKEGWDEPVSVHNDGWELSGCPVNGPSVAADGETVAVAWFTGANDVAAVKVAFSDNGGQSFSAPARVDWGNPAGRVDLEMLEDGSALVSWVEWTNNAEVLVLCRVVREAGCSAPEILATNSETASVNFPRMARIGREIYIAWTQADSTGDNLAMRRAVLAGTN
ncbi:MAG: exo-alpha-sialidase, partial [Boseongicola sp.]|nr:exo-alpha-sialidase [Boseongicola sp.]